MLSDVITSNDFSSCVSVNQFSSEFLMKFLTQLPIIEILKRYVFAVISPIYL